ncbi:MAG: toll/interleukin-1 receptor domain-containing protein [Alistipes sp.]|nr:toll/interleukin-1 receptor domain-containing protein [Alistipes sp.]
MKNLADLIKNNQKDHQEALWETLTNMIWDGKVIPVIGDSLILKEGTISELFIKAIADAFEIQPIPNNFSDLHDTLRIKKIENPLIDDNIWSAIQRVLPILPQYVDTNISDSLKQLLSIKKFRFVITTSVDDTVERIMKNIWEERHNTVEVKVFRNDPSKDPKECESIKDDMVQPTLYYMFGKADTVLPNSYVLTDEDLLTYCQSWLSEGNHPEKISNLLANKYLLFWGVNYPDWLVRFLWFAMRNNKRDTLNIRQGAMIAKTQIDTSLINFLKRISIETQSDPQKVVNELTKRLKAREEQDHLSTFPDRCDFFISYSHRDKVWAEKLYNTLTAKGYTVWYDATNIIVGDRWPEKLRRGIESCKRFIPLFSPNIIAEADDKKPHPYRQEWDFAITHLFEERNFILQVYIDGVPYGDPGLKLPADFARLSSSEWKTLDDVEQVADKLIEGLKS